MCCCMPSTHHLGETFLSPSKCFSSFSTCFVQTNTANTLRASSHCLEWLDAFPNAISSLLRETHLLISETLFLFLTFSFQLNTMDPCLRNLRPRPVHLPRNSALDFLQDPCRLDALPRAIYSILCEATPPTALASLDDTPQQKVRQT